MTRRLRTTGVGLAALLLPACLGTNHQRNPDPDMNGYAPYARPVGGGVITPRPMSAVQTTSGTVSAPSSRPPTVVEASATASAATVVAARPDLQSSQNLDPSQVVTNVKPDTLFGTQDPPKGLPLPEANDQGTKRPWPPNPEPVRAPAWPKLGGAGPDPTDSMTSDQLPVARRVVRETAMVPDTSFKTLPPAVSTDPQPAVVPAPESTQPAAWVDRDRVQDFSNQSKVITTPAAVTPTGPKDSLIVQALRAVQSNQPDEAARILQQLDPTSQEVLHQLMPPILRLGGGEKTALKPEEVATLIEGLRSAEDRLKARAPLRIERVCFCKAVRRYGDYDAFENQHTFHPGDMVTLYAELKNFTCKPITPPSRVLGLDPFSKQFEIRTTVVLELRDLQGGLISRYQLSKADQTQTAPQDYFHQYRYTVPDKLPPGTYNLWIHITDQNKEPDGLAPDRRVGSISIPFRVSPN